MLKSHTGQVAAMLDGVDMEHESSTGQSKSRYSYFCSEAKIINKSLLLTIYYFKNLLFKNQGVQKGIKEKASLSTPVLSRPVSFPRGNNKQIQFLGFLFNNILHMCKHRHIHHFLYLFNINHNKHIALHLDF